MLTLVFLQQLHLMYKSYLAVVFLMSSCMHVFVATLSKRCIHNIFKHHGQFATLHYPAGLQVLLETLNHIIIIRDHCMLLTVIDMPFKI